MYLCGTPAQHCTGGNISTNAFLRQHIKKGHHSSKEAFRCYRRYLTHVLGYELLPGKTRELRRPEGGIVILAKQSKFGARLKPGKEGRWMPRKGHGTII